MRILFITDNFPPEVNAPATRTFEHCREWVARGAVVTVITGVPNFPRGLVFDGYENRMIQSEDMDGIRVVRVWSYIAANAGFARRIVDYVSFALSAFLAGLREDFDVVIATSPQFFTTFAGAALSRVRGRPWIFELRDLWPESIVATGSMKPGFAVDVLERLELTLYRDAALVVAVTPAFKSELVKRGIRPETIRVVTNGVYAADYRLDDVVSAGRDSESLTVGYIGTHGLAHGLEIVLDAAERLAGEPIRFVLVGDGARRTWLVEEAERRGLRNVEFRPPVTRGDVPALLAEIDLALVPLRRAKAFTTVIPSKIFEAAAAGRPILLGVEGQAQRLVEAYGAGLCFEPENADALVSLLERIVRDPDLLQSMRAGCARLAADFDRGELARRMLRDVESVVTRA